MCVFASDVMGEPIQCFFVYEKIPGVIVLGEVCPDYNHRCAPLWGEFYDGEDGLMLRGYLHRFYVLIRAFVFHDNYPPPAHDDWFIRCMWPVC